MNIEITKMDRWPGPKAIRKGRGTVYVLEAQSLKHCRPCYVLSAVCSVAFAEYAPESKLNGCSGAHTLLASISCQSR